MVVRVRSRRKRRWTKEEDFEDSEEEGDDELELRFEGRGSRFEL